MKDFARSNSRLRNLPFHARLVYSWFLALTLVALAMTAWLGADMLGNDLSHTREYYAGSSAPALDRKPEIGAAPNGPAFDVPDSELPQAQSEAIPLRKLLEVTHFHLFSMPVYLLILSHLFMLCGLSARAKTAWITAASLAVVAHLAAPWIARAGGALGVLFYACSGAALAITFLMMTIWPLFEMWQPKAEKDTPAVDD